MTDETPRMTTANYTYITDSTDSMGEALVRAARFARSARTITFPKPEEEDLAAPTKRLVRVIIADADDNIPVEDALLYSGHETFTDKTDQELFFDIPIGELLKAHNEKRVKIRDKDVRDREEFLEPARIRDLDMVVLTIAAFGG